MADLQTIKEKYASMTDAELTILFHEEKDNLTEDANTLLKAELAKRSLMSETAISYEIEEKSNIDITNLSSGILHYIVDQKEINMPNAYITGGLIERGLTDEEANEVIKQIPDYAEFIIQKSSGHILTGTTLLVSGLSISFLPLSHETHQAIYIIAYTMAFIGALKLFHGITNKQRFRKIKNNS